jgi:hypothetical protein
MDVLGTAVGVTSLGITLCQGLLDYYNTWKTFDSDIDDIYKSVTDLSRTLKILENVLKDDNLDKESKDRVGDCVTSCFQAMATLLSEAKSVSKNTQPVGTKQKILWKVQRLQYPFRANTLTKLKRTVNDIQGRLQVSLHVQQLVIAQRAREAQVSLEQAGQEQRKILVSLEKNVIMSVESSSEEQKKLLVSSEQSNQKAFSSLEQQHQQQRLKSWLAAADPWTNHISAHKLHEPGTGDWLLQSSFYQRWKMGAIRHIWLSGPAGCGKTIISSTLIKDVQAHCVDKDDTCLGIFYFTFSDRTKQTYDDLLRSLAVQLGMDGPGLTILQMAYDKLNKGGLGVTELEDIVISLAQSYSCVFIMLDALDECPEEQNVRYSLLQGLEKLAQNIPTLKYCVTSRGIDEIRDTMAAIAATPLSLPASVVDADIALYVSNQLVSHKRLADLSEDIKALILENLSKRAHGV